MRRILMIMIAVMATSCLYASDPNSVRMVKSELIRHPESKTIDYKKRWKWNYTHGLMLEAMMKTACKYPQMSATIDGYVCQYLDTLITTDGTLLTYDKELHSLNNLCPGRMLLMAYDKFQKPQYKIALDSLYAQYKVQPRVAEGAFWHRAIYPHQVWLEGSYMSVPFYCQYASRFLEGKAQTEAFDDAVRQITVAARHTYHPQSGLYVHAWDETKTQAWSDPATGKSKHVWGRALGWYCMAMVDALEYLPANYSGRDSILNILQPLCEKIRSMRDKDYGIWYQVMDQGQREGNYLETSCSTMFAYTFIKGAQNGWLTEDFLETGKQVYDDINNSFIREEADDVISLTRSCSTAGLGLTPRRNGSYEYYVREPVVDNDPKAVGPYIMTSLLLGE